MGTRQQRILADLATGMAAGAASAGVMSAVMFAAQRAGLVGKQPPALMTETTLDAAGTSPRSEPARRTADTVGHLGFGGALGGLYSVARRAAGDPPSVLSGIAWGLLVWLVNYGGWIPALRIMPAPPADRPGRQVTLLAGHLTYGAALGALLARRRTG